MSNLTPVLRLAALALTGLPLLAACASDNSAKLEAPLPTEAYTLQAQSRSEAIHLKINPKGFSENQRRALDQIARRASWDSGEAVDVRIVTANGPDAVRAGYAVRDYLMQHQVEAHVIGYSTAEAQPADVVSISLVEYRADIPQCGQSWENLGRTGGNKAYKNFGCSITANLAAQVADPRDLAGPQTATPADAGRRAVVIDKYRKGEVTSAADNEAAKGTISDAIK
ncbi:CpaD family pilus assembly protein [Asticcacaulis sp. BYS171W]|uniref:CpaD family pilus assembly protein n=1 Tax=Asticcacaulis aquaticus TaxID=2984212 RepID=A0ABT5HYV0_9CAUL|nr:CpaD family pilus assembly protein [Asticcacaulis aquaticus]MDC7685164.1 CpaD family pilus assembly protein [Asticcacaulis aquaticus]